jgi:hypothetical protein
MFSQQLQVQEADHPEEVEKTEEKGGKLPVDLVKVAEIAISRASRRPRSGQTLALDSRQARPQ